MQDHREICEGIAQIVGIRPACRLGRWIADAARRIHENNDRPCGSRRRTASPLGTDDQSSRPKSPVTIAAAQPAHVAARRVGAPCRREGSMRSTMRSWISVELKRDVLRMPPAFRGSGQAPGHEPAERGRSQRLACRERCRLVLEDRRHQRSLRIDGEGRVPVSIS